jgi:translocation and assembly module TamB
VLTDPGLQIEATRKVKDVNPASDIGSMPSLDNGINTEVTVGIRILGTLNNPQITLFSIPIGLTQAQILSSLGGEGSALIGALSALSPGISNAGGLMNKFTKMLGSTEINIASVQTFDTATNQMQSTPSFVVGKKISQKLSLHYSIGIFNPVSVLNVRYQLNKHWAIQSETSTIDNGADILYGFERP